MTFIYGTTILKLYRYITYKLILLLVSNFNYGYQVCVDYLESSECANDDSYNALAGLPGGNIPISSDWIKGHGHKMLRILTIDQVMIPEVKGEMENSW